MRWTILALTVAALGCATVERRAAPPGPGCRLDLRPALALQDGGGFVVAGPACSLACRRPPNSQVVVCDLGPGGGVEVTVTPARARGR